MQIMKVLTLIKTLEYYDVPHSEPRLMAFVGGQLDLRDAYVHPSDQGTVL